MPEKVAVLNRRLMAYLEENGAFIPQAPSAEVVERMRKAELRNANRKRKKR